MGGLVIFLFSVLVDFQLAVFGVRNGREGEGRKEMPKKMIVEQERGWNKECFT